MSSRLPGLARTGVRLPTSSTMENGASETAGKPIKCRAAVCRRAGEPLVMEEIQVDPPKAWEVRIKIVCTSICHTDVTFWKMDSGPFAVFPRILGHEAVGVVESVGEKVEEVKAGDTVLPVFWSNCEKCRDCESAKGNACSVFASQTPGPGMQRDGTGRFSAVKDGEAIHHFLGVSSFSEYTVVDVVHVVKISSPIPVDRACLLSCGVSTGVGGAWKVADVEQGSSVVIFGLGVVGLAVAEGARLRGASKIVGVDLNPDKFELGKKFGVTDFVNPEACGEKPISEVIKEITDGGSDYSFECIGLASVMADAFNSSREVSSSSSFSLTFSCFEARFMDGLSDRANHDSERACEPYLMRDRSLKKKSKKEFESQGHEFKLAKIPVWCNFGKIVLQHFMF
ncbi:uncharacterized protein J3R85_001052 [Psidium guajava]|nr:uncharacterized protein J3R85_001052 [Psidium guajava]